MAGLLPDCGVVAYWLTACNCLLDCDCATQVLARWPEDAGARWDRAVLYGELGEPRKASCMHHKRMIGAGSLAKTSCLRLDTLGLCAGKLRTQ